MALSPQRRALRARIAAQTRHQPHLVEDSTRAYKALAAEDYLRDVLTSAPRLTAPQRDRLIRLLQDGGQA